VADRERVKKSIRQLQRVKTWQLFIIFILMAFVAATFLRLNNIGMLQRREAVLAADKTGDMQITQSRLYELHRYSAAHMNTDTGPFDLESRRDVQKAVDAATSNDSSKESINAKVDKICRSRVSGYGSAWIQCFSEELAKFPPSTDPEDTVNLPSPLLYRHAVASPLWTPDFAGWSVFICAAILLVIAGRLASLGILRLLLKKHYRGI
jgi:hypothetical protein